MLDVRLCGALLRSSRALRADSIKMFVLDEADEMLSRGFKDQIYDIFQLLPPKIQVRLGALALAASGRACGSSGGRIQPASPLVDCPHHPRSALF